MTRNEQLRAYAARIGQPLPVFTADGPIPAIYNWFLNHSCVTY
jgi:hypothetical protein